MSSTSSTRFSRLGTVLLIGALLASGCASRAPLPQLESVRELTGTPFFPQTDYDCGPAALATILAAAGVDVDAAELVDAVYIDGLRGSLQAELIAATRRYGMLPVPIEPDARSLLAEIEAGRPVLVLQNLAFERVPRWHYAVVVGFDAASQRFVLRSGTERRRHERTRRFLRSWQLSDGWAIVALGPDDTPAGAAPGAYMRALVGAERHLDDAAVSAYYRRAAGLWPAEPVVQFLAGVRAHDEGDATRAAKLYRRTLAIEPEHAAARNNLANLLLEQGCRGAALREAEAALQAAPAGSEFHATVAETLRQIESSPAARMPGCVGS